ncbi:hypothetical protein SEVIR_8G233800v4 [Setaria viridis]|uniref:Bifunctional inhibitor/plant lipid transfer protein/seed storage helical domain-containing protein n=1 Tax=Setaria viridis TaxID=4556 RepID=A0A4U6TNV7_SETVI|nr:hypothetical protein SEVIR_8G233800v2 [Setaria viridis]
MAPKSAAALVLLAAAMIAGLAPTLQAQLDPRTVGCFFTLVDVKCSRDGPMRSCARRVASNGGRIPPDCCNALLARAATSGEAKQCACGFGNAAAAVGVDVDQMCQQAGGPSSKLSELCRRN